MLRFTAYTAMVTAIAGTVLLTPTITKAQSDPQRVWQFNQFNDPNNKGRLTARLAYGIPETDDVQLTGVCDGTPSTSAQYSLITFGTDVGKLKDNKEVELQFSGGGFSHKLRGTVAGTKAEIGVTGVQVDVAHDDPLWNALLSNETLDYFIPGYSSSRLSMAKGRDQIKAFVETCKDFASALSGNTSANAGGTGDSGLSEKDAFALAKELGTADAWRAFLSNYPTGFRSDIARAYLNKLGGSTPNVQTAVPPVPPALPTSPAAPAVLPPAKPKAVVGTSRVRISQSCSRQNSRRLRCRVRLRNTGNRRPSGRVSFRAIGEILVGPGEGTLQLAGRSPDRRSWRCSRLPANSLTCSISGRQLPPGRTISVNYTINVSPLRSTSRYLVEGCARLGTKGRFVCDRVRGPRLAARPRPTPPRDHGGVNCAEFGQVYHNGVCRRRCPSGFENVGGFCNRNDELRAGDRCGPGFRWSRAQKQCVSRYPSTNTPPPAITIRCIGGRVVGRNCICPRNSRKIPARGGGIQCIARGQAKPPVVAKPPRIPPCPPGTRPNGRNCVNKTMVCKFSGNSWGCVSRNPPTANKPKPPIVKPPRIPPCPRGTRRRGRNCLGSKMVCNLQGNNWSCVSRKPPIANKPKPPIVKPPRIPACPPGTSRRGRTCVGSKMVCNLQGNSWGCVSRNLPRAGQTAKPKPGLSNQQKAAIEKARKAAERAAREAAKRAAAVRAAQEAARRAQAAAQRAAQQRAQQAAAQRAAAQRAARAAQEAARKAQAAARRAAAQRAAQQRAAQQRALKAAQEAARRAQQAAAHKRAQQEAARRAAAQRAAQQRAAQQRAIQAAQQAARRAQQAAARRKAQQEAARRAAAQRAARAAQEAVRKAQAAARRAAAQRAAQQRAAQQRAIKAAQQAARRAQQAAARRKAQQEAQRRKAQEIVRKTLEATCKAQGKRFVNNRCQ